MVHFPKQIQTFIKDVPLTYDVMFLKKIRHSDVFRPKWQFYDNLATSKAILTIKMNENTLQLSMVHLQKQI